MVGEATPATNCHCQLPANAPKNDHNKNNKIITSMWLASVRLLVGPQGASSIAFAFSCCPGGACCGCSCISEVAFGFGSAIPRAVSSSPLPPPQYCSCNFISSPPH